MSVSPPRLPPPLAHHQAPQKFLGELEALRAASFKAGRRGVIGEMPPDRLLEHLLKVDGRPYGLLINFRANTVIKAELKPVVKAVDEEFAVLSRTFSRKHPPGRSADASRIFFLSLDFEAEGGKEIFRTMGVQAVPAMLGLRGDTYVRRADAQGGSAIPEAEFLPRGGDILRAEGQAAFVKNHFGVDPGPVFRPNFKDTVFYLPLLAVSALVLASAVWAFFFRGWHRSEALYLAGALAVFWFSSGGYMFTIIRKMPFRLPRSFFYQARTHQTVSEALVIGGLYLLATLGFVALIYWLPRFKASPKRKARYAYAALGTSTLALMTIYHYANWKTGANLLRSVFKYSFFDLVL